MARSRNIKPGFFKNEVLAEMPFECRLLFIGIWTLADREGRLEDRPKRIKAELFAFDSFDVDPMLSRLQADGFLVRYDVGGSRFIQIENFVKHQDPHYKEKASDIPAPEGRSNYLVASGVTRTQRARIMDRDGSECVQCGAKEHLCIDHKLPISRGGTSDDDNLQVLCLPCNTAKGNKLDGETKHSRQRRINVEPASNQHRVEQSHPAPPDSLSSDSGFLIPDSGDKRCRARPPDDVALAVLGHLNRAAGRSFRPVEAHFRLITARLREGNSPADLIAVIDAKVAAWKDDPKMSEYLRPETLFSATKFASYVGSLPKRRRSEWWLSMGYGSLADAQRDGVAEPA